MKEDFFKNNVKTMLKNKQPVSAAWIHSCSNVCTSIIASAGFDVAVIDMEHSPVDMSQLVSMMQATAGSDTVPFVRAPWNDIVSIKRILDCGAYGIHIPFVNNKEEAEFAVRACKYPTLGVRGTASCHNAARYGLQKSSNFNKANDEIVVMVAIETKQAADNVDSMLEIEGLDGIFIGPSDLGASMGYLGRHTEEVEEVIRDIEEKVLKSDKFLGTVASGAEDAQKLYDRGYSYAFQFGISESGRIPNCKRESKNSQFQHN